MLRIPQPYGEVVDRLVILALKCERMADPERRAQARRLYDALATHWDEAGLPPFAELPEWTGLQNVNAELWDTEDALRACERDGTFGERFIALARRVYGANDARAALKAAIDRRLGSPFVEPKEHR